MPRINLLPAKRLQREETLRQEMRIVAIVLVGLLLCLLAHERAQSSAIGAKQARLAEINATANAYTSKIKQIEEFKEALKLLGKKLGVIDSMVASKQGPTRLLAIMADELGAHPRVWLQKLAEMPDSVRLSGQAMSQGDISAFQMALSKHTEEFSSVVLELVTAAKDTTEHVLDWSMTISRKQPTAEKPAEGSTP